MVSKIGGNTICEVAEMYVNSGYLHNSRTPFKEKVKPLRILSAGTYQLHSWPKLPTWRPRGRVDWQLIYIAAGKGYFIFDNKEVVVPAGNMVLFQPKEEQHYYYLCEDRTQVWFVHFTGRDVRTILQNYGIPLSSNILCTGLSREYEDYFRKMRDELVTCRWGYEEMLSYLFRELLMTMHRRMEENLPRFSGFTSQEIDLAKEYFTEHYNEEISIEDYALSRHVSASWFNKNFKKVVGTTPMKYILSIRILNAQTLLETTDYNISNIASMVGYENAFYFSRLFKKQKGVSPAEYRKIFREKYKEHI